MLLCMRSIFIGLKHVCRSKFLKLFHVVWFSPNRKSAYKSSPKINKGQNGRCVAAVKRPTVYAIAAALSIDCVRGRSVISPSALLKELFQNLNKFGRVYLPSGFAMIRRCVRFLVRISFPIFVLRWPRLPESLVWRPSV